MARFTEEELSGLTDEEREALLAEDQTETDEETDEEDIGEEADADDDVDADADVDDEADAAGDDDGDDRDEATEEGAEGEDAEKAGAGEGEGESPAQSAERAPVFVAEAPGDANERLTAIASEKEKLIEQFDDGELTAREYQLALDKLAKEERAIELAIHEAEIARKMAEQQAHNDWMATVNRFLTEHPQYTKSPLMHSTLDMTVRQLAQQEENASLTGAEILAKAHEMIVEQFGLKQQEQPAKQAKPGRKAIEAPPTLAKVPAADMTETENTRWSRLDRLMDTDPERYEAELAKLSDADRDAYLSAN